MVLMHATLLVTAVGVIWCQVVFPENDTEYDCIASNLRKGNCYEYRSDAFKECSFFPSINTDNPDLRRHLEKNVCLSRIRPSNQEKYFCCPSNNEEDSIMPTEQECGISLSNNIIGGESTNPGAWPWLAAIGPKDQAFKPFCGGILITKQHVLTAAHCFNMQKTNNSIVRLGEHKWEKEGDGAQDFDIVDERKDNFNRSTKENDIILLKLSRPLERYTDNIRAACLPYHLHNESFEGKTLIVVGWGKYRNDLEEISPEPKQAHVPVVPLVKCQENYKASTYSRSVIDDRQLCAGTGTNDTDSCNGDSGGPINYLDNEDGRGRFFVVGLVSFGPKKCAQYGLPGVYTRIGHYLEWIEESIVQMQ